MRMPQGLERASNDQIGIELFSSTVYLQMSVYFADRNLVGMSRWIRAQAEEERPIHPPSRLQQRRGKTPLPGPSGPTAHSPAGSTVPGPATRSDGSSLSRSVHAAWRPRSVQCRPILRRPLDQIPEQKPDIITA